LIVAQPLGAAAQRHLTTSSQIGKLEVIEVRRSGARVHRVLTQG
jgi:hypothetical protein